MNAGDTGFMMICAAMVFFMTPGLAFFYGGLVVCHDHTCLDHRFFGWPSEI